MPSQPIRNESGQFYRILSLQELASLTPDAFRSYQLWLAHEQSKRPANACAVCGTAVEVPGWSECQACHSQLADHSARMQAAHDAATFGTAVLKHRPDDSVERIDPMSLRKQPAHDPILHLIERYESEIWDQYESTDKLYAKLAPAKAAREFIARSVPVEHPDSVAVRRFAEAMIAKMKASRAKGRSGWNDPLQCSAEHLQQLLIGHLLKGDPVDVANFCMMLWNRGLQVVAP